MTARPAAKPIKRSFLCTLRPEGNAMTVIEVPFDPREVFGRSRVPVRVAVGRHSFRSTIFTMHGCRWIPLRKSNREAAGVRPGQRVRVTLTHDTAIRTVTPPAALAKAIRAAKLTAAWKSLSYTHQREHAESITDAKQESTRARRIGQCLAALRARRT